MTGPRQGTLERRGRMADMYKQGATLAKIGQHFGVTRQYVEQNLKIVGITRLYGGANVAAVANKSKRASSLEARSQLKYGLSFEVVRRLREEGITSAFQKQKQNAGSRGIGWRLKLGEWLHVWESSGKLSLRGRGRGRYVMSRFGDVGPYELGNVHIQLSTDNNRDGMKKSHRTMAARRCIATSQVAGAI